MAQLILVANSHAASSNPLKVVVDIPPTQSLLHAHGWGAVENVEIEVLLEPNQSAHHFALSPAQVETLAEADVILGVGSVFLPEIVNVAKQLNKEHIALFYDDDFLAQLQPNGALCKDEFYAHDVAQIEDNDPHIWLSQAHLKQMGEIMNCVLETVSEIETKVIPEFTERHNYEGKVGLIASHEAFGYFERENGIESFGAFHDANDQPLVPRDFERAMNAIQSGKITCLLSEAGAHAHDLEEIAEDFDLLELEFDIFGWQWQGQDAFFAHYFEALNSIYQRCAVEAGSAS